MSKKNSTVITTTTETITKEISDKEAIKQSYRDIDVKVASLKEQYDAAVRERSDIVKKMFIARGGDKSAFTFDGRVVSIVSRRELDDDKKPIPGGRETWFLKGPKNVAGDF